MTSCHTKFVLFIACTCISCNVFLSSYSHQIVGLSIPEKSVSSICAIILSPDYVHVANISFIIINVCTSRNFFERGKGGWSKTYISIGDLFYYVIIIS